MKRSVLVLSTATILSLLASSEARAQAAPADRKWSIDFGIGWDNSLSGNVISSAIGDIDGQPVVILKNSYSDVYGTGLNLRFGAGYMMAEMSELRGSFTIQTLEADLALLGDIGSSKLYGQLADYQSIGLEFGYRRYVPLTVEGVRMYGEGTVGLAFIDKIEVMLVAPQAGLAQEVTDFYDATGAFTFGVNTGVLFPMTDQLELNAQLGLRFVTGLSEIDALRGTGLAAVNDKSARWTLPFVVGVKYRF